jgi:hypothetical protein
VEQPQREFYHTFQHLQVTNCKLDYEPLKWYKENPFVHAAIEERAKILAKAKFYFQKDNGELIENEYTTKLNKPNTYQSGQDFIKQFGVFLSIYGTGYFYQNKLLPNQSLDKFDLFNIPSSNLKFNVPTDYILYKILGNENVDEVYYQGVEKQHKLDLNNLLPIFDTTTFSNPYYSESRLKALVDVVSNSKAILESTNTFMSNPGGIGIISSSGSVDGMAKRLSPAEKEEIEKQQALNYGSTRGKQPFQIYSSPVAYTSTMPKISDLKLNETLVNAGLTIFGAFGLPKEAFTALASGSTFENQREAYKGYIEMNASVDANNIASTLNEAWKPKGGKLIAKYDHLSIMQEDEKAKAETRKLNADTAIMLLDKGLITTEQAQNFIQL